DHTRHMNHSSQPNVVRSERLAPFGEYVAAVDIAAGDELTCDYFAFDADAAAKLLDAAARPRPAPEAPPRPRAERTAVSLAIDDPRPWWLDDALSVGPHGLELDGVPLGDVAREHGTPVYAYGARTVRRRLGELRAALRSAGAPFRIQYAMKA